VTALKALRLPAFAKFVEWLRNNPNRRFRPVKANACPVSCFLAETFSLGAGHVVVVGISNAVVRNIATEVEKSLNLPKAYREFILEFDRLGTNEKTNTITGRRAYALLTGV